MHWNELNRTVRKAIMREAVRRGVAIDDFFVALGGVL